MTTTHAPQTAYEGAARETLSEAAGYTVMALWTLLDRVLARDPCSATGDEGCLYGEARGLLIRILADEGRASAEALARALLHASGMGREVADDRDYRSDYQRSGGGP